MKIKLVFLFSIYHSLQLYTAQNEFDIEDPDILRNRINEEIDKLPPRCAEIFKLSRFEG